MQAARLRRLPSRRQSHSNGTAKLTEKMRAKVRTPKKTFRTSYSASIRLTSRITTNMASTILRELFKNDLFIIGCLVLVVERKYSEMYKECLDLAIGIFSSWGGTPKT